MQNSKLNDADLATLEEIQTLINERAVGLATSAMMRKQIVSSDLRVGYFGWATPDFAEINNLVRPQGARTVSGPSIVQWG